MAQYLGSDDAGVSSFSLQEFEPSFGSKLNAAVRESWLESYGPVAADLYNSKFGDDNSKKLTTQEAADYAKQNGGGVKMTLSPKDGQYTEKQWSTIVSRQRELAAVKDVRERTPWDMGSVIRGGAMFGAGIVDPINLATAFVPWTKAIGAMNGLRAAAMAESALTRFGARAAIGAADAGISTAALEPAFAYARNQLGDDYGAMDSLANIAFGTAFGGGLHSIGGAAGDAFKAYRARGSVAPAVMTPELQAAAREMTPEARAEAGIAPESARAGMPEIVEARAADPFGPLSKEDMAAGKTYAEPPTLRDIAVDVPAEMKGRRDLLAALRDGGGISPKLARDAGGENGMRLNRKLPGVVKKDGITDYDQIAEIMVEQGFLPPGTEFGSQEAIDAAQEMVTRAFNGDRVVRISDQIAEAERRTAMDYRDYIDSLNEPVAPAAELVASLDPETREATLRASVAQAIDGRNVDVEHVIGMDESLQSHTVDDAAAAADKNFTPEEIQTADHTAAAEVQTRNDTAPKWEAIEAAEQAMTEADTALADTIRAGDQAFKYSRAGVTETEAFKKWFGDSKVTGEGGEPLVVYHGTTSDFTSFSTGQAGKTTGAENSKLGFFFTDRPEIAGVYVRMAGGEGGNIIPSYLSIKNPLELTAKNMMEADKLLLDQLTPDHDGAIISVQGAGKAQTVYMTRESGQIKSATGNRGTFDGTNPDIRYSRPLREMGIQGEIANSYLDQSLRAAFGTSTERLMADGRVKLVSTPDDIPGGPHPADVKAATAPDGSVYVVAENVSESEARGILLHEVGVHVGMERMLGTEVFQSVLSELDDAVMRGEAWAQKARASVPGDTPMGLVREEQLAYLVQNAPELPIVKRIIAAVRAWAYQNFEFARDNLTLTEADFQALAVSALHAAAGGETGGVLAGAYARASARMGEVLKAGPFAGMTRGDFLGSPKITSNANAADLRPSMLKSLESKQAEPFLNGKYSVVFGDSGSVVMDGGNVIASYAFGDTLVVDKKYRRQGIGAELVYQWRNRYPEKAKATTRTKASQAIQEQVWDRMAAEHGANAGEARYSRGETPDPATVKDELKPYDDNVARAKSFGSVLRAAADKLDNDAQAAAAMRAAMPEITAGEINDLLGQLRKQVSGLRGMARTARNALRSEDVATGMQSEAMKAADTLANNLELAAVIEKRNAALNINARMKASAYVNQFRDAKLDFEGFRGLLVGTERKRAGGRISVEAEQKNFRGEWMGGLIADLETNGLMQHFTGGEFDRDIYQALHNLGNEGKGNEKLAPEAVKIAEVVNKFQTDARNTRNRFGAWIRDLNGYITRQSHDMFKIRDAGERTYKDTVLPLLDVQRSMRDFDGSVDDFLTRVYDDFAAGSHMKAAAGEDDIAALGRGASLAKRESQSRVLYFKDGNAAYEYNQKFGEGRLAESVLKGLDHSAKSAGLLKLLGTNPEATATRLFDEYAESLRGDPARRAKFLTHRNELQNLLSHVDGSANIPGNATAAKISSFIRAWESMSKLGGMLISSVTDLTNYAAEMRFGQDKNLLTGTLDGIGSLTQGRASGEKKAILNSLGVFHESTLGAVFNRFDSPDLMGGKTAAAMQMFFKLSGINWWTESLRDGYALSHSAYVASQAGKAFDKIDASLRDMLGLYNIDAGKWDVLRLANTQQADGRAYITPEGLRTVPRQAFENYIASVGRTVSDAAVMNLQDDLASALRTMTIDRMHHAVIEPGARTRAFMLRGTKPGTVPGELLRFVSQFKSFPVALIQSTLGREVYGRGYDTLGQYLRQGKGDMLGLASFIALSTAMGYAAMSAKDLLKGKNPRPVDDPRTWAAAMIQGGGLGIYGDFLFGKFNRTGQSLSASLGGPVIGVVDTAADLWTRVRNGDDVAAASFNAALQNTPFANLFYTRVALDYLILYQIQDSLNPGFLRRMERRIERENGQSFFLPPSQVAR